MGIKVGIIGCGSIAKFRHAPEYAHNEHVTEVVYYDRNRSRAEELALLFGGRVVDRIEDILEDDTIDAISDCSTNEMHHIISTEALNQGKHVLCEKPMAVSIDKAKQMVQAASNAGKILMVDHNQRFIKTHIKVKEIIKHNELGRVLTFKTSFGHKGPEHWGATKSNLTWFFSKSRSEFGVTGDLGIHKIDLIRFLLDDEITEVSAMEGILHKKDENGNQIEVCDNMICLLKTAKGAMGTASFSWTYYGEEDNSTIVYCENGMMKLFTDSDCSLEIIKSNGETTRYKLDDISTNDKQISSGVIDSFVHSIVHGSEPPVLGTDGVKALEIVHAIAVSIEKRMNIFV